MSKEQRIHKHVYCDSSYNIDEHISQWYSTGCPAEGVRYVHRGRTKALSALKPISIGAGNDVLGAEGLTEGGSCDVTRRISAKHMRPLSRCVPAAASATLPDQGESRSLSHALIFASEEKGREQDEE